VVERGHHSELLAQGGLYAGMWDRQREADEAREKLARTGEEGAPPDTSIHGEVVVEEHVEKPPVIAAAAGTLG
jgi:hypothetical protein